MEGQGLWGLTSTENLEPMEEEAKGKEVQGGGCEHVGMDRVEHAEQTFQRHRLGRNNKQQSRHCLHIFWEHFQGVHLYVELSVRK